MLRFLWISIFGMFLLGIRCISGLSVIVFLVSGVCDMLVCVGVMLCVVVRVGLWFFFGVLCRCLVRLCGVGWLSV